MSEPTSVRDEVAGWFRHLERCVRAVDYDGARPIFAEEAVGFGTYGEGRHIRPTRPRHRHPGATRRHPEGAAHPLLAGPAPRLTSDRLTTSGSP